MVSTLTGLMGTGIRESCKYSSKYVLNLLTLILEKEETSKQIKQEIKIEDHDEDEEVQNGMDIIQSMPLEFEFRGHS